MSKKDVFAPSRRCISMDTLSLPEKFWQSFRVKEKKPHKLESQESVGYWRRYSWSRRNGWNQKEVIDLFAESTSILKMRTISACLPIEVCDLFADLFQGSENEKVFDLFAELTSILKSPINQTTKRRCASPEDSESTIDKLFWSPRTVWSILPNDWTKEMMIDAFAEHLLWTMSFLLSTIDDGVDLLFWIFLVLKNA